MDISTTHPRSIRSRFDRQIKNVQLDVLRMGALVEKSCWLAHQALFDRNLDAAAEIVVQDKAIDRLYRQIEVDCINVMALQAPVSHDLRLLSALMQLVRDLERIGDYAKDIGEIAVQLFPYPVNPCMDHIRLMLDRCRAMVAMSLEALTNLDAQTGKAIKVKDDLVDSDYESLYQQLVKQQNIQNVEPIVLMVLVIRHLERMADHATNIGNRVVFVVTGERF